MSSDASFFSRRRRPISSEAVLRSARIPSTSTSRSRRALSSATKPSRVREDRRFLSASSTIAMFSRTNFRSSIFSGRSRLSFSLPGAPGIPGRWAGVNPASRIVATISSSDIRKETPAEATTFSSIIVLPKSSAPKKSPICATFAPIVTHDTWTVGTFGNRIRDSASTRRYPTAWPNPGGRRLPEPRVARQLGVPRLEHPGDERGEAPRFLLERADPQQVGDDRFGRLDAAEHHRRGWTEAPVDGPRASPPPTAPIRSSSG